MTPSPTIKWHPNLVSRSRRARKRHICMGCGRRIPAGHIYIEHKSFPGHDAEYANQAGHPVRGAECSDCACRYGRSGLLGDPSLFPESQEYRYWLGDGIPRDPDPMGQHP